MYICCNIFTKNLGYEIANRKSQKIGLYNLFSSLAILLFLFSCSSEDPISENSKLVSKDIVADSQTNVNSDGCDPCNCVDLLQQYLVLRANCVTNGGSACQLADEKYEEYLACLELVPQCPPGFTFDGCNCYSGVHFPDGYTGFVWNNGFYVKQNCEISTDNDCCPKGFEFDGANCHYFGLYFPDGYVGFVWGNAFYTKPGPCVEE